MRHGARPFAVATLLCAAVALATPSGHKWFGVPTDYRVYGHSSITGVSSFSTNVLPRVQAAFLNWTKTQVSCTKWDLNYLGQFTSPSGTSAVSGSDNENRVIWLGGSSWRYSNGTLGLTTTSYYTGTGEIFDADMELNNNISWSSTGANGTFDYESVVLHEAGHFLGLDHTTNSGVAVMYPSIAPGDIKRVLQTPDLNDVCNVYPGNGTPGAQGSTCLSDSNCVSGLKCRTTAGGTSKMCTVDCTSGQACPAGTTCQAANTGKACLVPVGAPDLCKFCTSGTDCSTGSCITDDGRHNWCTTSCTSAASCGAGYDCVTGPGGGGVCAPTGSCSNQCPASSCPNGYACVGGTCEATGNVGDRCEVSVYCKPCSLCMGTSSAANCRACCGGNGGGGDCNSCSSTSCATGQACQGVSGSNDKVCIPSTGASTCSTCSGSVPCAVGACVGGRCHTTCNPGAPGACAACYDTGGSTGYCACPDEVALAGQSCGPTGGGGFTACSTGLACVASSGTATTCHRLCTLGEPATCPSGSTCQAVSGKPVCVAGTGAGSLCASCNNGTCGAGLKCFQGRCYQSCNPTAPSCITCVSTGAGSGVCACPDQLANTNQTCGFVPPGDVYACKAGLTCVSSVCRAECNLGNPLSCYVGTSCQVLDGTPYCLPTTSSNDAGGGGGGGGGGSGGSGGGGSGGGSGWAGGAGGGGGGGGGAVTANGCGCGAGTGALSLWSLVGALALGLRRRVRTR